MKRKGVWSPWGGWERGEGGGLFVENLKTCVGRCEIKPPIYEKFIEKNNCIRTNGMLENETHVFVMC